MNVQTTTERQKNNKGYRSTRMSGQERNGETTKEEQGCSKNVIHPQITESPSGTVSCKYCMSPCFDLCLSAFQGPIIVTHLRYEVSEQTAKEKEGNRETLDIRDREMHRRKLETEKTDKEKDLGREMIIIQRHIITPLSLSF